MKILTFTNCCLDPNLGSGKTVGKYSQGLKNLGHSVDLNEPKDYEVFQQLNRAIKFRQAWGAWLKVKEKLKAEKYDIIEFYGDEFWLAIRQLSKLQQRPLLVAHTNGLELLDRERSYNYKLQQNHLRNWFDRQTHARFSNIAFAETDAFVSLCELDRQYVLNLGLYHPNRTAVVEPGLDEEYLSVPFSPGREERIAFMGSWISRKGIANLCAVTNKILTQKPQVQIDLYGTKATRDTIISCFPKQLHDRIVVHPRLDNQEIAKGLAKAKVFLFPTQYEGYGMAIAEAMACGCAVVTTPTGFGAELKHEREALLCDFNDIEAMEKAVLRLLEVDELRVSIARMGWERVRSLTWEANIKKLEAIYKEWVAGR